MPKDLTPKIKTGGGRWTQVYESRQEVHWMKFNLDNDNTRNEQT